MKFFELTNNQISTLPVDMLNSMYWTKTPRNQRKALTRGELVTAWLASDVVRKKINDKKKLAEQWNELCEFARVPHTFREVLDATDFIDDNNIREALCNQWGKEPEVTHEDHCGGSGSTMFNFGGQIRIVKDIDYRADRYNRVFGMRVLECLDYAFEREVAIVLLRSKLK